MLLNEIVNMQRTNTDVNDKFTIRYLNQERKKLGDYASVGMYGGGNVDANDPHIFNKSTFTASKDLKSDAYYQYIKMASKWMKSNPFLPRVYLVNIDKDVNNSQKPNYKMESLLSVEDIQDCEQVIQIAYSISQNFGKQLEYTYDQYNNPKKELDFNSKYRDMGYDNKLMKDQDGQDIIRHEVNRNDLLDQMIDEVTNKLEYIITGKPTKATGKPHVDNTINPKLLQVIKIIRFLQQKYHYTFDIHQYNYMFRRTPYGLQLVITDPLT